MGKKTWINIVLILSGILTTTSVVAEQETSRCTPAESATGCTSKFLLPDRPFMVIWNEPSQRCDAHGISLNLSAWDIVENEKDAFAGDNMNIYYRLGEWPELDRTTGKIVANGGVPQRGNLTNHLGLAKAEILKTTKPDFDGVAVIDMEEWRPTFGHNFGKLKVYQKMSEDIVKARYPYLNTTAVVLEATKEFDAGARLFMESTLNLTHTLRPNSHWGYYGLPRNWGGTFNDRLAYLWQASRGLFPRIYMQDASPVPPVEKYIYGQVNETLRVWAKFSSPDTLILPYSLCQDNATNFFSVENLTLSIGLPGKMGAAGVVLWGSSGLFHTHDECQMLQKYVNTVLGPYVKNLTRFLTDCSVFFCSAHGRCVDKGLEKQVQWQRVLSHQKHCLNEKLVWEMKTRDGGRSGMASADDTRDPPHPYQNYTCRCLPGWTGQHCEKRLCDGREEDGAVDLEDSNPLTYL